MSSKKAFSADNQQEKIETCGWIVGIVDGEGSFLVNVFKSPRARMGWQVFPEFNVSQTKKGIDLLYALRDFFGCGHIYVHTKRNRENKNWDPLHKYCVRAQKDLRERIIPFFRKYPPRGGAKRRDFELFVKVVGIIQKGEHLNVGGIRKIIKIIEQMTHRKPFAQSSAYKFLSSSETIRRGLIAKNKTRYSPNSMAT